MLERVLYRDRAIVVVALLSVIVLSWFWVALGAGMDMSAVEMTRMPRDMVMTPAIWTAGYAALMLSMWFVMMVAMMLPSATPILLIFARVSRRERAAERPWMSTGIFASGYLAAWACFSVGAVAMQWGLEESGLLSAMMVTTTAWLSAAILIAAGLWQILPIKHACLRQCRSPVSFLAAHWRVGRGWCVPYGPDTRCLLPGMLRVPNDAAVFWRCHEPLVGRGACSPCPARKDFADWPLVGLCHRGHADRLGRISGGERRQRFRMSTPSSLAVEFISAFGAIADMAGLAAGSPM